MILFSEKATVAAQSHVEIGAGRQVPMLVAGAFTYPTAAACP
jgi:hypothetical protein